MKKELKLSILIKTSDMYDFILKHTYSGFSGIFGVILSLSAFIYLAFTFTGNTDYKNLLLIIVSSLFTWINPLLLGIKAKKQILLNPVFKTPLDYTISEEGIMVSQNTQELKIEWKDVLKVTETKRSFIIYLDQVRGYIFPKQRLEDQKQLFIEIVRENIDESKFKVRGKRHGYK